MNVTTPSLARARLSLDGLSVGDAFGQCFFNAFHHLPRGGETRRIPSPPWLYTDDSVMACAIVDVLARRGTIDQDELAMEFARRYMSDPDRGYGGTAKRVLTEIYCGMPWRTAATSMFPEGSMGNGSAMRVAPLGAYFADDVPRLADEARRSAEVTHAHREGVAGAIAVAFAAAFAWTHREQFTPRVRRDLFDFVLDHTPDSAIRAGIAQAADLPRSFAIETGVSALGNGSQMTCPDTVPLCIWLAARHSDDFVEAMWATASALGDMDTNCAIVGGIVALSAPESSVPQEWLDARGAIPIT